MGAACAALLLARSWGRLWTPDLWAEDGHLFLEDALRAPWSTLLNPYGGYFHTVPRLVASLGVVAVPLRYTPEFYFLVSLVIYAGVAALISGEEYRWLIPGAGDRVLTALILCAVQGMWEVLGNLANLHWVLFAGSSVILLKDPENPLRRREVAFIALASASAGETVLLLPLAIRRLWVRRLALQNILADTASCAFLAGMAVLNYVNRLPAEPQSLPASELARGALALVRMYTVQPLIGPRSNDVIGAGWLAYAFSLFVSAGVLVFAWIGRRPVVAMMLLVGGAVGVTVLSWRVRPGAFYFFASFATSSGLPDRYIFISAFTGVLFWVAAVARRTRWAATFSTGAVIFAAVHLGTSFRGRDWAIGPYSAAPHWISAVPTLEQARATGHPAHVTIPISPPGWSVVYRAPASP